MWHAIVMLFLTMIPLIVVRCLHIQLPWHVYFFIAVSIFIHTTAATLNLYVLYYPYYDKIAHIFSAVAISLIGFFSFIYIDLLRKMKMPPPFIIICTIIFVMACGVFWEIGEFIVDNYFGGGVRGLLQASVEDTIFDMTANLIGSLIGAGIGLFWFKNHRKEDILCDDEVMGTDA